MKGWFPVKWIKRQFDQLQDENVSASETFALVAVIAAIVILVVIILGFFLEREAAGQFGDYIGGTLNPILTFVTFVSVLVTIILQRYELIETRKELREGRLIAETQEKNSKRQLFENTFFQMLSARNELLKSIVANEVGYRNLKSYGADALEIFMDRIRNVYESRVNKESKPPGIKLMLTTYEEIYPSMSADLAHYFRYMFRFVKYIDESEYSEGVYIKILRSSMSNPEIELLMLNGISSHGLKFKYYIEKYSLLDNVPDSPFRKLSSEEYAASAFE